MIKSDRVLNVIYTQNMPARDIRACDIVCSFGIMEYDALLTIANPESPILRLGKRAHLKFYDLERLRSDGVYVNKANFGGSGAFFGPRDIVFNLHINKQSFFEGYEIDVREAGDYFAQSICYALTEFGVPSKLDKEVKPAKNDGACIHLQERGDVVSEEGRKLAVTVYQEDDLGFYLNGAILVSTAWYKVYDYLTSPMNVKLPETSVEQLLGREGVTHELTEIVINNFGKAFGGSQYISMTDRQRMAIEGIRDKYRVA